MNYADTSFLVSLYTAELHSGLARKLLLDSHQALGFTPLHRAEWEHAVAQGVMRKLMLRAQAAAISAALESDLRKETLAAVEFPPGSWERCAWLARKYGRHLPMRTLDSLHVACALELDADEFWTFDGRQGALAGRVGLTVRP